MRIDLNDLRQLSYAEKGCVTFTVENEFSIVLTLDGVGKDAKWKVIDIKILVSSIGVGYESELFRTFLISSQRNLLTQPSP